MARERFGASRTSLLGRVIKCLERTAGGIIQVRGSALWEGQGIPPAQEPRTRLRHHGCVGSQEATTYREPWCPCGERAVTGLLPPGRR